MDTEFNDLQLLTEAVIDKRGFFYHGDSMPPKDFIKAVTEGTYNNTSSLYGKGMYCVRHIADATQNRYGPYIYKLYVRGLDNFLHLDEMPYRSVFGIKGRKDDYDSLGVLGAPSYSGRSGTPYSEFVLSQFNRLANRPLDPEDVKMLEREIERGMEGRKRVGLSSEIFYKIHNLVIKYGIAGVTYTGYHDGRCALVYDFKNVFPVAWAEQKALKNTIAPDVSDKKMDSAWTKKSFSKLDYSDNPEARGFLTKWSGEKNVSSSLAKDRSKTEASANRIRLKMYSALKKLDSKAFMRLFPVYAKIKAVQTYEDFDVDYQKYIADFFGLAVSGDSDGLYSILAKRMLGYPMPNELYRFYRGWRDRFQTCTEDYGRADDALRNSIASGVDELDYDLNEHGISYWDYSDATFKNFLSTIRLMDVVFYGTRGDAFFNKENVQLDKSIVELCDWCIKAFQIKIGNLNNLGEMYADASEKEAYLKLAVQPIVHQYETCIKTLERLKAERGGGAPVHSVENSGV